MSLQQGQVIGRIMPSECGGRPGLSIPFAYGFEKARQPKRRGKGRVVLTQRRRDAEETWLIRSGFLCVFLCASASLRRKNRRVYGEATSTYRPSGHPSPSSRWP